MLVSSREAVRVAPRYGEKKPPTTGSEPTRVQGQSSSYGRDPDSSSGTAAEN